MHPSEAPRRALALVLLGLVAAFGAAFAAACAGNETAVACKVGADCASGICGGDGVCQPAPDAGGDASSAVPVTTGQPGEQPPEPGKKPADAGTTTGNDDGGGLKLPGCVPNNDGTITRDEVPIKAGLHGIFRYAENVEISTAGEMAAGDKRKWDLSGKLEGDANVYIETLPLDDKWYANSHPGATYSTALSKSATLFGVFETAAGSLALRGVVSEKGGPMRTELTNDPPVEALKFPLKKGSTWTTTTNVTGVAPYPATPTAPSGPWAYTEKYDDKVDAEGDLKTPLGTFHVLRVRIDLTRTFPTTPPTIVTTRQYAFITECYGNVASISSKPYEMNEEFTNAAEVKRIAP